MTGTPPATPPATWAGVLDRVAADLDLAEGVLEHGGEVPAALPPAPSGAAGEPGGVPATPLPAELRARAEQLRRRADALADRVTARLAETRAALEATPVLRPVDAGAARRRPSFLDARA